MANNLPREIYEAIFERLELPAPEVIGRERWEHLKRNSSGQPCRGSITSSSQETHELDNIQFAHA